VALWLNRAGRQGQHLLKFREDSRIYLTWTGLDRDLSQVADRADLSALLTQVYPEMGGAKLANHTGRIWRFAHEMQVSDWVIVPDSITASINVAEITGDYTFVPEGPDPYFHYHAVRWLGNDIPRTSFDRDLLYSFGGLMTIYKVERNEPAPGLCVGRRRD
jgi:restriction system protein